MFNNLFKSARQREMERNIAIQRALAMHRQQIGKLEQHERGYTEKALRAKKSGDLVNFKRLCKMVAQTANERRSIESQLLYFETMIQTRDKARLFKDFADGMKAMTKSINEAFAGIDITATMRDVETAFAKSGEMENAMNLVLDRIASQQDFSSVPEGGISAENVEQILLEQEALDSVSIDKQIESGLAALRETLKTKDLNS